MFKGAMTALATPFRDSKVDEQAFQDFVEWQIAQGIHGLVAVGTTGESPTLGTQEHIRVIELCVEATARRVPVIAGIGSNNTTSAVYMSKESKRIGADGVLAVAPYYNKPSQNGMLNHFRVIADAVDIPMVIYNIPGRSIVDIDLETMAELAQHKNIVGVKDATSDITRVSEYIDHCGEDFIQLSGDDPTALAYRAHGGHGCISVASNVAPAKCAALQNACDKGDYETARALHHELDSLFKDLFVEPSPAPTKYALSLLGKMAADVRLPIISCSPEAQSRVRAAMTRAGVDFGQ
ncbi:MAG TPA: 4-hydroxy-tetrahydrodipicolinate synthase [Hellea balneolensis]|uniref:4-hydroxy-tetrahydrodipicolinate synthase n=1 Tax=Hellea balneolensis TaxID=287478 RepID=A0A7C5R0M7_9PROT|nr:4-hydroxy-tetrahydrodipicolinate synthase [Hellea balneolensis]